MTRRSKDLSAVAKGRALAVEMLDHFAEYPLNRIECFQWSIQAAYREEGTKQDNVVLRYLRRCKDPETLAGFCSVLTEHIGSCVTGSVVDSEFFEKLTERDMTGKPGPWPTPEEISRAFEKERAEFKGFMGRLIDGERRI